MSRPVLLCLLLAAMLVPPVVAQSAEPAAPSAVEAAGEEGAANDNLPRIAILATGGTIAGVGYDDVKDLDAAALEAAVPGISEMVRVQAEDPYTLPSSLIQPKNAFDLVTRIRDLFAEDSDLAGIVVTQGTDSLEEVSFLVDLLVEDPRPVVFTGAMRRPGQPGDDGGRNLRNAVRLAITPEMRELGVLVTMNDEVHAAREIRKTDSTGVDAFTSPSGGPIARFDGADLFLMRLPTRRVSFASEAIEPQVDLVRITLGTRGHLIKAAVEAGAKGIVLELFGRANPGGFWRELWAAREQGVVIVAVSRIGRGPLWIREEWQQKGLVFAEDLDGLKARLVLMAALPGTQDPGELQEIFDRLAGRIGG